MAEAAVASETWVTAAATARNRAMPLRHARALATATLVALSAACGRPEPRQLVPGEMPAAAAPQTAALPFDPRRVEVVDHWTGEAPGPVEYRWRLERQGATYTFAGTGTLSL